MDQVTKVKNEYRLQQWSNLIKDCQSSGMKVDAWCETNGISRNSYYYWLRKIREAAFHEFAVVEDLPSEPVVLKKLEVQTPVPDTRAAVIIRLGNAIVEINEGTSQQTIQAVQVTLPELSVGMFHHSLQ